MLKDTFPKLALRFTHENLHRKYSAKYPKIYRGLGVLADKAGLLKWLYRDRENPDDKDELEKYMARPRRREDPIVEDEKQRTGKKMRAARKLDRVFNPLRIGGMALAAKRISESHVIPILEHLKSKEHVKTEIYPLVAEGESTFPSFRITRNMSDLGAHPYTTIDRADDHSFYGFEMRNILEILDNQDDLDSHKKNAQ